VIFLQNWKLIALDMDGTSLKEGRYLSEENREWLLKARDAGIEFTFATGRHRRGIVAELVQEMNIQAPIVTMNGGEVWAPDGELLARHPLSMEDVSWLRHLASTYRAHFWAGTTDGPVQEYEFPDDVENCTWLKFGFFSADETVVRALWEELQNADRFELTNSHPLNIEVNPRGVTKATGLQVAADYLGIEPSQIVAMGDSLNDIPMLRWAGLGIAMGNAQPSVKSAADWVTLSCEEDGVAYAIEKLLDGAIAAGKQS
jgi:5-amino-6-(5-phospho-D-ribitylamino)uracil phosphatase